MSSDLDFTKLEQAKQLVEKGNRLIEVNCSQCQGMGSSIKDSPGYCPECEGNAYIQVTAWTHWSLEKAIDYWQARSLIAEARVKELQVAAEKLLTGSGITALAMG